MALVNCPECNHEVSDTAMTCPHCGYDLRKSRKVICPECNHETTEDRDICPTCGYKFRVVETEETAETPKPSHTFPKGACYFGLVLAVVLIVIGLTRVNSERYKFYENHKQECMDAQTDVRYEAARASYYLSSNYDYILDEYDDMIKEDEKQLNIFRVQAVVLCVLGVIIGLISIISIMKGDKS